MPLETGAKTFPTSPPTTHRAPDTPQSDSQARKMNPHFNFVRVSRPKTRASSENPLASPCFTSASLPLQFAFTQLSEGLRGLASLRFPVSRRAPAHSFSDLFWVFTLASHITLATRGTEDARQRKRGGLQFTTSSVVTHTPHG